MTYKEFFKALRQLKGAYKVCSDGMIRAKNHGVGYCPIVGVSLLNNGSENYEVGGRQLGLSKRMIDNIVDAADNFRVPRRSVRRVRLGLLKTLGLKEVA